jgi:hypothetical protein
LAQRQRQAAQREERLVQQAVGQPAGPVPQAVGLVPLAARREARRAQREERLVQQAVGQPAGPVPQAVGLVPLAARREARLLRRAALVRLPEVSKEV